MASTEARGRLTVTCALEERAGPAACEGTSPEVSGVARGRQAVLSEKPSGPDMSTLTGDGDDIMRAPIGSLCAPLPGCSAVRRDGAVSAREDRSTP